MKTDTFDQGDQHLNVDSYVNSVVLLWQCPGHTRHGEGVDVYSGSSSAFCTCVAMNTIRIVECIRCWKLTTDGATNFQTVLPEFEFDGQEKVMVPPEANKLHP